MSRKTVYIVRSENHRAVKVSGSFGTNGSSNPTTASIKGAGFTVVRTSTGLYTLTFNNTYRDILSVVATMQAAAATDAQVQIGTWTASTKALQIRLIDNTGAVVASDVAADANNRINFIVTFTDTDVTK